MSGYGFFPQPLSMVSSRIHCPQEKFGDPSQSEPLGAEQMGGVETVDLFWKDPDVVRTSKRFKKRRSLQELYSWSLACSKLILNDYPVYGLADYGLACRFILD